MGKLEKRKKETLPSGAEEFLREKRFGLSE